MPIPHLFSVFTTIMDKHQAETIESTNVDIEKARVAGTEARVTLTEEDVSNSPKFGLTF